MKKKLFVLLMALLMVMTMMPTTAFAALNTGHMIAVRFTVLYVGDEFSIGYNYGASESTQFVCQYSRPHSDTAYNNHTIAISDIETAAKRATVNSGYQIVGWSKESNANPKVWGFNLTTPTACNKGTTIYLVAKNPNPTPEKPDAPTYEEMKELLTNGAVKIDCVNSAVEHEDKTYSLIEDSYTGGTVEGDATTGYTATITINPEKYVTEYNGYIVGHSLVPGQPEKQIVFKYDNGWNVQPTVPVTFNVECESAPQPPAPTVPNPPSPEDVKTLLENAVVKVHCMNGKASHAEKAYGLIDGSFTINRTYIG